MKKKIGHIEIPLERVHVELTNICQFDCVFCPKAVMKRRPGYMQTDLAKRIVTELGAEGIAQKVTFHVMGEPTLHKDFFEILAHAEQVGVNVGLTTNGAGLGGRVGQRLLDHNLYQIDVSLQTPDEGSYALRRAGGLGFDDYLSGVMVFFTEYMKKETETTFKFRFLNTMMQRNVGGSDEVVDVISSSTELRDTFKLWAGRIYDILGVSQADRQKAFGAIDKLSGYRWNVVEVYPNIYFETYVLDDWGHAFEDSKVRGAWAGYCFGMRDHFGVLYNGDVVLCCQDFDGQTAVGNLNDQTLREVLSSDYVGDIVRGFKRMQLVHPYCKRCLGSTSLGSWLLKPVVGTLVLKTLKPFFYRRISLLG